MTPDIALGNHGIRRDTGAPLHHGAARPSIAQKLIRESRRRTPAGGPSGSAVASKRRKSDKPKTRSACNGGTSERQRRPTRHDLRKVTSVGTGRRLADRTFRLKRAWTECGGERLYKTPGKAK